MYVETGSGGPTPPGSPDIPVANFIDQGVQLATGAAKAGWWDKLVAKAHSAWVDGLTVAMSFLIEGFDELMSLWMEFMTKAQGLQNPEFWHLTTTMISDLLGVEISDQTIMEAAHGSGVTGGMTEVGAAFINQLVGEFSAGSEVTPEAGLKAAEAFLGFLLSFSVREANMEFISTLIPEEYRFGEDFRRYAVDMARNIGLGRLSRRVLQAPIQALITTPLTWYYNQKYRPQLFPVGELFRTYTRGFIDDATLDQQLAYHGFPDKWKQAFIQEYQRVPYQTEFFRSYQFGKMSEEDVIQALMSLGYSKEISQLLFDYTNYSDANSEVNSILSTLATMRLDGKIDSPTWRNEVDGLPISPLRKQWYLALVGTQLEYPRKTLSLSEVQEAFEYGYISVDDVDEWLANVGYSDEDRYTLTLLTLHKKGVETEKVNIAKYKYDLAVAKAQKKGIAPPPPPATLTP